MRLPPASAATVFNAQSSGVALRELLDETLKSGLAYQFSTAASDALAALNPREAVAGRFSVRKPKR